MTRVRNFSNWAYWRLHLETVAEGIEEAEQLADLLALGADLGRVWSAATTTDRDRKQLLRTLIEEVILDVIREERRATVRRRRTLVPAPVGSS